MELEKTLTLRKPVMLGDVEYTELKLVEPTALQIAKAAEEPTSPAGVIALISLTAVVPRAVAEKVCARDFKEADRFFAQFYA